MKRLVMAVVAIGLFGAAAWFATRPKTPPEVPFARAIREKLVSTLTTNGKIEPVEFTAIRSEIDASVKQVLVERGQRIAQGVVIAVLDVAGAQQQLAEAESRMAQAEADLKLYARGGNAAALLEIDNSVRKARVDLDIARREKDTLERLAAKSAATRAEVQAARDKVIQVEAEIAALERKRTAPLPEGGREAAEARLREARTAADAARARIEQGKVRGPMAGVAYNVAVRAGAFVHPGDLIAEVGRLDQLRAILYVDEPELGRVAKGMVVVLTWDAAPGKQWTGTVDKLPTQIIPLASRQVGEVTCRISNQDGALQAGANVNAEIRSAVAEDALTIPKEAVRREGDRTVVLLLASDKVQWKPVRLGISSVTRVQVLDGLNPGDAVALPIEGSLAGGDPVRAVFPR